jgi:hypothetical protein
MKKIFVFIFLSILINLYSNIYRVIQTYQRYFEYGTFSKKTQIENHVVIQNIETDEIGDYICASYNRNEWIYDFFEKDENKKLFFIKTEIIREFSNNATWFEVRLIKSY